MVFLRKHSTESSSSSSSSTSTSISPPLHTNTNAEIKIGDSAMPATTTSKDIVDLSSSNDLDIISSNNVNQGGDKTVTEIVMMASVDTHSVELQGKMIRVSTKIHTKHHPYMPHILYLIIYFNF